MYRDVAVFLTIFFLFFFFQRVFNEVIMMKSHDEKGDDVNIPMIISATIRKKTLEKGVRDGGSKRKKKSQQN